MSEDDVDGGKFMKKLPGFFGIRFPSVKPPNNHVEDKGTIDFDLESFMIYNMKHKKRGVCVIINNQNFTATNAQGQRLSSRPGSEVDADNMERLFRALDFEVISLTDQTGIQIHNVCVEMGKRDHKDADCYVMVFLSHGEDMDHVWATDKLIHLSKILDPIKNCESLRGKPKLFFIQACRGEELDEGAPLPVEYEADGGTGSGSLTESVRIPLAADFLIAYSTPPGHYSFRNGRDGSWFIQAVYFVFMDYLIKYRRDPVPVELQHLMLRVNRVVAYVFITNMTNPNKLFMDRKKQVPWIASTLTKKLYFTPKS